MEARSMESKPKLHEHLIWEILLRLPVKSLVRFKCVSKSWLSLISDVNFAKLHYDLTASSHTPQLVFSVSIVDSNKAQIRSIDPEGSIELVHSVKLVSPFQSPLEADYVHILGVCRGFILLGHGPKGSSSWPPKNLLVWNPSNGIHRTLTYSKIGCSLPCLRDHSICASYSFEYDALTDDYFVVIAWIRGYSRDCKCIDGFELFSMRSNSWKQFYSIKDYRGTRCCGQQLPFLFFNGAIHWLNTTTVGGESVKAIDVFDFTERNYSEIPLPDNGFVNNCIPTLGVIGGCLCLLCFQKAAARFAVVWMMKEYKVKSSWTKCFCVPQHDASPLPCFYFNPIYFTKAGHIVGYSSIGLAKLNDKGELLHHQRAAEECHIYTDSLLSLPTDSGQA